MGITSHQAPYICSKKAFTTLVHLHHVLRQHKLAFRAAGSGSPRDVLRAFRSIGKNCRRRNSEVYILT